MDIRKLQRAIVDGLEDVKAQHITVFNTEHLSSMFERVIIASGTSNRQTKALAASVRNSVKSAGMPILSTEGEDNGEWIIVDCGAAVVHVMQPGIREYYHLEEIWGGKSVRMKVGEVNTKLVKASEPEPAPRRAPRRAAAQSAAPAGLAAGAAAAKAPVRASAKASAAKPASPSRPSAGGKAAKTEADKKMANRTAAYKRVATKSAAPKRATAKTAATKTAATQTAAPRKAPARKAPARKAPSRG
jgi:ribosome-associated protein